MDTITTEDSLGISFCKRLPLSFTHGAGSLVWDEAGNEYLDFTSGWGVTCLGHSHPVIVNAISEQAGRLMQGPNAGFTYSPARSRLLKTLQTVLPDSLTHAYFCNSGAEANDAVLKLARRITGRSAVVSTIDSFHGRSLATLSVSRGPDNAARFPASNSNTGFIAFGDNVALQAAVTNDTAAVIVEPIQGEGGVRIATNEWLQEIRSVCDKHGALLIIDEVQTGFCRTGRFFAHQNGANAVVPDFMTMGKGIAGGFPFAAFAVTTPIREKILLDDHGGTYCGNPLGCAVSDAVIRYLVEHRIADAVRSKGVHLTRLLKELAARFPEHIRDVRTQGLLCALELRTQDQVIAVTNGCAAKGLLIVPTRNRVIRILPDLLVSTEHLNQGIKTLSKVLSDI